MITYKYQDQGRYFAMGRVKEYSYSYCFVLGLDLNIILISGPNVYKRWEVSTYDMQATDWAVALNTEIKNANISINELKKEIDKLNKQFKKGPKSNTHDVASLARNLPGVDYTTFCPGLECPLEDSLYGLIMHLNDTHKWTREAIADWLETLDADLEFK